MNTTDVATDQRTTVQLTATQHAVLAHAIQHTAGKIEWFPEHIKGGAVRKVLDSLFNRALITPGDGDWFVAAEGYDALGCPRPTPTGLRVADPEIEAAVSVAEATWTQGSVQETAIDLPPEQAPDEASEPTPAATPDITDAVPARKPTTRPNSKQATVLQMLQRPEGATIAQISAITGWQSHSVRGLLAGNFKKKLGLVIHSEKPESGDRVYHVR